MPPSVGFPTDDFQPAVDDDEIAHPAGIGTPVYPTANPMFRIMGGEEALPGWFPYVANRENVCGAALIAPQWIITAGHCGTEVGDLFTFNRHNLLDTSEPNAEFIRAKQVFTHPGYDVTGASERDDLQLVFLEEKAKYTTPLRLPTEAESKLMETPAQLLTVAGWGTTGPNNKQSAVMRWVNVPRTTSKHLV